MRPDLFTLPEIVLSEGLYVNPLLSGIGAVTLAPDLPLDVSVFTSS